MSPRQNGISLPYRSLREKDRIISREGVHVWVMKLYRFYALSRQTEE